MSAIVGQCVYCGRDLTASEITIDHVIPRSRGGRNDKYNTAPACSACNQEKGPLTAAEYLAVRGNAGLIKAAKRKAERLVIIVPAMPAMTPRQKRALTRKTAASAIARGRGCVAVDGFLCHCASCRLTPESERRRIIEMRNTATARFQAEVAAAERARAEAKAAGRKAGT